ncbi:MAG: phosphate ABC transporter, permease protein PstA, partial [Methanothrix soehngenii]|nr:phosphate ABC transporter, permease protein PstA [Methanothrix soehngenii]
MKLKPALAASVVISAFLFVSSLICLILQPELDRIKPIWEASLILCPLLILGSYLTMKGASVRTALLFILDILFCGSVFYLSYSGALNPDFIIKRPLGVGASFEYSFLLPLLVLVASLLCIKDALNIVYGYTARGREALVFLGIRMSAMLSIILLGGILFIIIYKGIWVI